jgi:broad specificity phosphatase PhoE
MSMTRLLLVRHGETMWNSDAVYRGRSEVPLSEQGRLQAEYLGRSLSQAGLVALHTSPLMRSRETADAIARYSGISAQVEPDLTDIDCGEWEGLSDAQVKEKYSDLRSTWLATPHLVRLPGGESLQDVSTRVARVLAKTIEEPGVVVLVSHRVVHKVAICALLGLDNSHFWDIRLDLAGITEFECSRKRRVMVRHNDVCHLPVSCGGRLADF